MEIGSEERPVRSGTCEQKTFDDLIEEHLSSEQVSHRSTCHLLFFGIFYHYYCVVILELEISCIKIEPSSIISKRVF